LQALDSILSCGASRIVVPSNLPTLEAMPQDLAGIEIIESIRKTLNLREPSTKEKGMLAFKKGKTPVLELSEPVFIQLIYNLKKAGEPAADKTALFPATVKLLEAETFIDPAQQKAWNEFMAEAGRFVEQVNAASDAEKAELCSQAFEYIHGALVPLGWEVLRQKYPKLKAMEFENEQTKQAFMLAALQVLLQDPEHKFNFEGEGSDLYASPESRKSLHQELMQGILYDSQTAEAIMNSLLVYGSLVPDLLNDIKTMTAPAAQGALKGVLAIASAA
ncbi:MAG: hypothetical protein LHV68_00005, partial [Elusimicrobia bacterium]|nr:hypothetical protein [Candidatus Liberimonas magnetica]